MSAHIYKRFPDRIEAIKTALQADDDFGEIFADYEEICTWLAARQRPANESCKECERAVELRAEPEQEISRVLKQKGF